MSIFSKAVRSAYKKPQQNAGGWKNGFRQQLLGG